MCQTTAQDGTDHRDERSVRPNRVLEPEAAPGPTHGQPQRRGETTSVVGAVGIALKDSEWRTVMRVPMTVSVAGFVVPLSWLPSAPAAVAAKYSTEVEREAHADHGHAALRNRARQSSGHL